MLTHAHFEAGECFFKQRDWTSARKHFEAGLIGHGLSNRTEEHIRKYHVYCVYALGKQKAQGHQYEAAKEEFGVVLNGQHKQWLQRWNKTGVKDSKDYVEMARKHLEDCNLVLKAREAQISAQTEVVDWAETNHLFVNAQEMEAGLWLKQVGLEKYTDAICGEEGYESVVDLQQLGEKDLAKLLDTVEMKPGHKSKFTRKLQETAADQKAAEQVISVLQHLAIVTLGDLVKIDDEKQRRVRSVFEEVRKRGTLFEKRFSEIKVAISFEGNCGNSYTLTANCSMISPASAMSHSFTKKIIFAQTRSARGNPVLQAKFDVDVTQIEPESEEEKQMYSEGVTEVAKLAECSEGHIRVKDARPGSIVLHVEFLPSKTCCAETAAARYIENITALTCASEKDLESSVVGNLGLLPLETSRLMPLETLQILGQMGAIEEFAFPPKALDDGEELQIWQHGSDKAVTITCTIVRTLGKGSQGVVYEVTSDLVAEPRAVKCAHFSAAAREMLALLRLNSPYTQAGSNVQSLSHRNVLRIYSVCYLLIDCV
jgi:hypothetical protein